MDGNGNSRTYTHNDSGNLLSIVEGGFETKYSYNTDGLLTSLTYPAGNSVSYTYDSSNPSRRSQSNLLSIKRIPDSRGGEQLQTSFTYEPYTNQITTFTDEAGKIYKFNLDERGNPISVISPIEGISWSFEYNRYGQIQKKSFPSGRVINYSYYPEASPGGTSALSGGRALDPTTGGYLKSVEQNSYTYDNQGNLLSVEREDGTKVSYEVGRRNEVLREVSGGIEKVYSYDSNGNITQIQEIRPEGEKRISLSYNLFNNPVSIEERAGAIIRHTYLSYDGNQNIVKIETPARSISFKYDSRNLKIEEIRGKGGIISRTRFEYDSNGNLTKFIDPRGKVKQFFYDGLDELKGAIHPGGLKEIYELDPYGRLISLKKLSPEENLLSETRYRYDPLGRLIAKIERLLEGNVDAITSYQYDRDGNLISITDPLGRKETMSYDSQGRMTKRTDPEGNTIEWVYDGRGNIVEVIEKELEEGVERTYRERREYDSFNRLIKLIDNLGNQTRFFYDSAGNLTGRIDSEGNKVSFEYDGLGRMVKKREEIDGKEIVTEWVYEPCCGGGPLSMKDSKGNITRFEYDSLGRLTKTIYPDGSEKIIEYDESSNPTKITEPDGLTIQNYYDSENRLIGRIVKRGEETVGSEEWRYDLLGRLTKASNDVSEVQISYDSLGRAVEEIQNGKRIRRSYNLAGEVLTLQYPDGRIVNFERDGLGRIKRIKEGTRLIASMIYGGPKRMLKKEYGNGIREERVYDGGRRMTELLFRDRNGGSLQEYQYGWSRMNMRTYEKRIPENLTDTYSYDSVYRLIEAKLGMTEPSNPQSFRARKQYILDLVDNIQKIIEEENGTLKEISTEVNNLNQYVRFGTLTLRYDGRGNLVEKGGKKFSYDWAGKLISVEEGSDKVTFKYDALGRRIEKASSQGATRYYYDGWDVIEERDANDRVKAQYVYSGLDQPVELTKYTNEGRKTYYFHQNSIGSISFITDETGGIVEKVEYEPYGKPRFLVPIGNPESPWQIQEQSSIENNYLFQGREYDYETSLYNFRMRYYDPEMGRFLSRDPEGYKDSANLYQAFNQNPINFKDPYGTQFRADTMTGEDPHRLMERWEKEGKMDEWKRLEEAYNRLTSGPDNPFFLFAETLRQVARNEREKACIQKWMRCIATNIGIPLEGAPFTGGIADITIAGGKAGEIYFKAKAYEEARKHALKTGRQMFWRFKVYKKYMGVSKAIGIATKGATWLFVVGTYTKCLVELTDCYLEFLPKESFEGSLLYLFKEKILNLTQ